MKKRYRWIYIWLIISIAFAIVIHIIYHIEGPKCLQSVWGAGDILTYASTVALGLLALWQNQKMQEMQDKKDRHNLAIEKFALFNIVDCEAKYVGGEDDSVIPQYAKTKEDGYNGQIAIKLSKPNVLGELRINMAIFNIGNCLATDYRITDASGKKAINTNIHSSADGKNDAQFIQAGEKGLAIVVVNIEELIKSKAMVYYLCFCNPFGNGYRQKITISILGDSLMLIDLQRKLEFIEGDD